MLHCISVSRDIVKMEKRRKYSEEYLQYGFDVLTSGGSAKPQCVLCNAVLSAESMKPSKLKRHLATKHAEHMTKDLEFFRRHQTSLKHQRLDATGNFQLQNTASVQASFEVALEIAKTKKPYTIGETLIKPCMLKMVRLILGEASEIKMRQISLSDNTIRRRITEMALDVKEQVLSEIKMSPLFAFQLDESTDVSSCSQLLAFVRYVHADDMKEEFLFCTTLEGTTRGEDVMEKVKIFFEAAQIQWKNVCGVCTDGAPSMLGVKSGFQAKVKALATEAKGVHCMIHRYALASKTLPATMQGVLDSVIKVVNYIKSGALNTRLFAELCKDMNSDHEVLLFYTAVRWLSKGNVVYRVFALRDELKLFLEVQGKHEFAAYFDDEVWITRLAYLTDILDQLNKINLKLQGKDAHIIHYQDILSAFISKLRNWRRKVNLGNITMFENLSSQVETFNGEVGDNLREEISNHLQSLENEFQHYFPELTEDEAALVRNPFSPHLNIDSIPDEVQDEFLDMKNDSSARSLFGEKLLTQFWCVMYKSYPNISMLALRVLLPFVSTYLCESGFSTLLHIKTKARNRLTVEDDMRLALTNIQPRISKLVSQIQVQSSH